jgi:hypothetical protein
MATIIQYMDDEHPAATKTVLTANLTTMAVGDPVMRGEVTYYVFSLMSFEGNVYAYCYPPAPDYTINQTFRPGDRVELCPSLDLWMRGAKYAIVQRICKRTGVVVARSEHKSVRNLIRHTPDRFRHVR